MGQCGAFLQFLVDMVHSGRGGGGSPPWTPSLPPLDPLPPIPLRSSNALPPPPAPPHCSPPPVPHGPFASRVQVPGPELNEPCHVFGWVEAHITEGNRIRIANYAATHTDEVAAVIQSQFEQKEELLLTMTMAMAM